MKKIVFLLFAYILFFQVATAQNKKKILLAYNYKVGNLYEMSMKSNQQVNIMGMDMPQTMTYDISLEVLSVDAKGTCLMKMTYKRVRFTQDNPVGKINVDTDSDEEQEEGLRKQMREGFGRLKGMSITMKVAKSGELIEVVEGDESIKQAFKQQNTFFSFPTQSIKVGKSWDSEEKRDMNGVKFTTNSKYTLKSIENGKITIVSTGVAKNEEGKEIGTTSTLSVFDEKDLFLMVSESTQDIKGLRVQGMLMDILSKSTIIIKNK